MTEEGKDPDVLLSHGMTVSHQGNVAVQKGISGRTREILMQLQKALARPHLSSAGVGGFQLLVFGDDELQQEQLERKQQGDQGIGHLRNGD